VLGAAENFYALLGIIVVVALLGISVTAILSVILRNREEEMQSEYEAAQLERIRELEYQLKRRGKNVNEK
jgi:type II secretory pathway pseudopilin PulG